MPEKSPEKKSPSPIEQKPKRDIRQDIGKTAVRGAQKKK